MAESIKFSKYIDSSGIVHNKKTLKEMIEKTNIEPSINLLKSKFISSANFNNIISEGNGLFICYGSCQNAPLYSGSSTHHWYCLQWRSNESYCLQLAIHLWENPSQFYIRKKIGGAWYSWEKVQLA